MKKSEHGTGDAGRIRLDGGWSWRRIRGVREKGRNKIILGGKQNAFVAFGASHDDVLRICRRSSVVSHGNDALPYHKLVLFPVYSIKAN